MSTDQQSTIDQIAERLERIERMWADLVDILGIGAANLDEPAAERSSTLEQARWVAKGDTIQAVHGDPVWEPVVSAVHALDQTGLVTRTGDGTTRLRWWAHDDLIRVETAPVQVRPFRPVDEDLAEARHRVENGGL